MTHQRHPADDYIAAARGELNLLERARFDAELARSPIDREAFRALARGLTQAQLGREAPSRAQLDALIARLEVHEERRASRTWVPRLAMAVVFGLVFVGGASAAWWAVSSRPSPEPSSSAAGPTEPAPALGSPELGPEPGERSPTSETSTGRDHEDDAPIADSEADSPPRGGTNRRRPTPDSRDTEPGRSEPTDPLREHPPEPRLRDGLQGGLPLWSKRDSDLAGLDAGQILALAEDRARTGRRDEAEAIYRKALRDPSLRAHHDYFRYGLARSLMPTAPRRAAPLLERVREGRNPELAAQASLAECELALRDGPCSARACLRGAVSRHPRLERDAVRLEERWKLDRCAEASSR